MREPRETGDREILDTQIEYYRARAPEYDEWWERRGRYDRGEENRRAWRAEAAVVEAALEAAGPEGDILELACGTGIWTRRLAAHAARLDAVDASEEVIALNRARLRDGRIHYLQADLFQWAPSRTYDFVFFGFWLSHVPEARFDAFWRMVSSALRPGGAVFFVDSRLDPGSTAWDQSAGPGGTADRYLNDGRSYRIVKVFYDPVDLAARLGRLGWRAEVRTTPRFFLHGVARTK